MDIWAWVLETEEELREAGHGRLADIMDQISSLVGAGLHAQVEALAPEGVALARSIDHPWVEVFLRHWLAQSRLLRRRDVTQGMEEVIRLLDFAHGDRTAKCPQSVCVAQDVCTAYAVLDGPGYGEERLAVSSETLARIDASWPCFHCISSEYADALVDLGRYQEAAQFCREQMKKARRARNGDHHQLLFPLIDALSRQGLHAEVLKIIEANGGAGMEPYQKRRLALNACREHAARREFEKALAVHPGNVADELDAADFIHWIEAEVGLVHAHPERNDARLGLQVREYFCTLRANGALFDQADFALRAAQLALARGRPAIAALHVAEVDAVLPQLRRPQRLSGTLAEVRALLAQSMPATADEAAVLANLGDNPEANLEALLPAQRANPASEPLTLALSRAYQETGFLEHALRELKEFVLAHPESEDALDALMRALVLAGDAVELTALAQAVPEAQRAKVLFFLGRLHVRRESWPQAVAAFEESLRLNPGVRAVLSNLSLVYRHVERHEESLALLDELASDGTDRSDDWDRMVVATLLERHDKVRESAKRLGYAFEGEGPIDERCGYCDLRMADAFGRDETFRCWRISPVVARILTMPEPGTQGKFRDEVLFEPAALNEKPESTEGKEAPPFVPEFRAIKVLRTGGFRTYDIDGVHPGDERIEALDAELQKQQIELRVRSGEQYQLKLGKDETVRGLYAFIAVPANTTGADVHRALSNGLADWPDPITYRGLLRELGMTEELARHEQIAKELNL